MPSTTLLTPVPSFSDLPAKKNQFDLLHDLLHTLVSVCPLNSKPARLLPSSRWLPDIVWRERTMLYEKKMEEIQKSKVPNTVHLFFLFCCYSKRQIIIFHSKIRTCTSDPHNGYLSILFCLTCDDFMIETTTYRPHFTKQFPVTPVTIYSHLSLGRPHLTLITPYPFSSFDPHPTP